MENGSEQHKKDSASPKNGKQCPSAELHQNIVMGNKDFFNDQDIQVVNLKAICYALQLENQQLKAIICELYQKVSLGQPILFYDTDGDKDEDKDIVDVDSERLIIDESSVVAASPATDIEDPLKNIPAELLKAEVNTNML